MYMHINVELLILDRYYPNLHSFEHTCPDSPGSVRYEIESV